VSCLCGPTVSVVHQTAAFTTTAYGRTEVWSDAETFNAILNRMGGEEALRYEKDTPRNMYVLYCDTTKADSTSRSFQTTDRIKYGTRLFDVLSVEDPYEQGYYYKLSLEELVDG